MTIVSFFFQDEEIASIKGCVVEKYEVEEFLLDVGGGNKKDVPNIRQHENKNTYRSVVNSSKMRFDLEDYFIYYFREDNPSCSDDGEFGEKARASYEFDMKRYSRSSMSIINNEESDLFIIYYRLPSSSDLSRLYLNLFETSMKCNEKCLKYIRRFSFLNWILSKLNLFLDVPHTYSIGDWHGITNHYYLTNYSVSDEKRFLINVEFEGYASLDGLSLCIKLGQNPKYNYDFHRDLGERRWNISQKKTLEDIKEIYSQIVEFLFNKISLFRERKREKLQSFLSTKNGYLSFVVKNMILEKE